MSKTDIIFQTIKDKGNPRELEHSGPIHCDSEDAWLGPGHYFWHGHIELGHWWGRVHVKGQYMICRAHCNIEPDCWDLHDNPEHRDQFIDAMKQSKKLNELAKKYGKEVDDEVLVSKVILWIKKQDFFKFNAIRAYGVNSMNKTARGAKRVAVEHDSEIKYIDLMPAVQLCLFEKTSLNLKNFKVVYPTSHIQIDAF